MKKILFLAFAFAACQTPEEVTYDQYMVEGQKAYEQHCANCHQTEGQGLAKLYPPLAGSDYLKNKEAVICMMKYGISGEMTVNGKTYNQAMPGNFQLQELDIALISTYIYNTWGNEKQITSIKTSREILKKCK
jgi:cytochrome c551